MRFPLPIPVVVLAAVFLLIAVRKIGNTRLRIWQIVLAGAVTVLITGQISIPSALSYIDPTVIIFLICIFMVGEAMIESGYLERVSYLLFSRARSVDALVLLILFSMGIASMLLMNDTLAFIGTPLVMLFSRKERINPKLMLLTLAFAVTIGSVASPIGNPQNLLIASSGILHNPFPAFFSALILPTILNLFIAYLVLRLFYRKEFRRRDHIHARVELADSKLATLCKISLALLMFSVVASVLLTSIGAVHAINLSYIAAISAIPLLFSDKRYAIFRSIDWPTIVFFISIFVLVGSVWQSGFLQKVVSASGMNPSSVPDILAISIIGSQFISNVPMVLLYLKLISYSHVSAAAALALAAGSTIAGNLLILGAASNVIIIQGAERRYGESLSFLDFARVGIVLTVLNALVYLAFLAF